MVEPTRNNENQFRNTLAQQLIIYNCNNDTLTLTLTLTNPKTTPKLLLNYNCSTTRLNDSTSRCCSQTLNADSQRRLSTTDYN